MPHRTGRPWIVAHRGARTVAPENTVEAFRAALRLGADAVELDARRTADGVVVVHHDARLEDGEPLITTSRGDVRRLAPHVPDLEEAMAACEGMWVNIEVKNNPADPDWDPEDRTLAAVVAIVGNAGAAESTLVSSFNIPTARRAASAGFGAGWLLPRSIDPLEAAAGWEEPGLRFALPSLQTMGPGRAERVVEAFEALGVEVGVWTVNGADELRRLADAGVGALFTDDVATAVATLVG